jgi:YidC/Oxa1 family membrane protein insertase
VAFTAWLQSRMTTLPSGGDGQAASMNQSMTLMMPLMFGFFSLNFSTGLSFYFVVSNVIGIVTQGFISGWSGLKFWEGLSLSNLLGGGAQAKPQQGGAKQVKATSAGSQKGSQSGGKKRKKKRRRKR